MQACRRAVIQWWAPLLFAVMAIAVTVHVPYNNAPPIRSDGLGYHLWTRAWVDGQLSFCDYGTHEEIFAITDPTETGRCANQYAYGLALLRFPVMAPLAALNGGEVRSEAEDIANQIFAIAAGVIAMMTIVAAARMLGVRDLRGNIAALAIGFGAGLFHSATYESSFTHVYNAALLGLLLLVGLRYSRTTREGELTRAALWRTAVAVGLLSFFVVATRQPLLLVLGGLTLCFFAFERRGVSLFAFVRRHRAVLGAEVVGVALALGIQLAYNRWVFGYFTISSFPGTEFSITQLRQLDVVFSFHKGLITWYPVVLIVFVLAAVTRQWRSLALLVATTLPLVLLYGAWQSWDLAGGFGHRGFVDLAVVYGFALALGLEALRQRLFVLTCGLLAVAVVVSLGLMRAYWNDMISPYGISAEEWVTFGWWRQSLPAVIASRIWPW
jgi:hypothetical protein